MNSERQGVKNVSEPSPRCTCNFSSCISCVASFQGSGYELRAPSVNALIVHLEMKFIHIS